MRTPLVALIWTAVAACAACGSDATPAAPASGGAPSSDAGSGGQADASTGGASVGSGGKRGSGGATATGGTDATGGETGGTDGGADSGSVPEPDSGVPPASDGGGGLPPLVCDGPGSRYASYVVSHEFGPGQTFGQAEFPAPIFGPPHGHADGCTASTDVVSLGNGGSVVLGFEGNGIQDGEGPDFIVFENPFGVGCDLSKPFAELGTVAVSEDGVTWHEFPCTAKAAPYGQCSGWRPVFANPDENDIDPTDPAVAGGDPYDLADVGLTRARLVRITDRVDLTGSAGVYDLDAVAIVHPSCP